MLPLATMYDLLGLDPLPEPFVLLQNGVAYRATLDLLSRVERAPLIALRDSKPR
jgi:hypothetical protein